MGRGGSRNGSGRKPAAQARPSEPMVSVSVPERIAADVTAFAREKAGPDALVQILEPKKRRRTSDKRPSSKESICNVRMSAQEQADLRARAKEAGFGSLQEFLYSQVVRPTPAEPAAEEPAERVEEPTPPASLDSAARESLAA